MSQLKAPGVYVEEVTKFPLSVAQLETAIPAFIGYTEIAPTPIEAKKIHSLLEYETYFGKAQKEKIKLEEHEYTGLTLVAPYAKFLMYYSLQMYFANGGGPCYIVSVGNYASVAVEHSRLEEGLDAIKDIDGPTLIVFPDATSIEEQENFYAIYNAALTQATEKKDRFLIMDTYYGNSVTTTHVGAQQLNTIAYFRKKIDSTSYGAAYFPHLKTILNYNFDETVTTITHTGLPTPTTPSVEGETLALINLRDMATEEIEKGPDADALVLADLLAQAIAIIEEVNLTAITPVSLDDAYEVLYAIQDGVIDSFDPSLDPDEPIFSGEFQDLIDALQTAMDPKGPADGQTLASLKDSNSLLYNQIKNEMASSHVVLPPSSTMAGVYAKTDRIKGVWKAPANTALNYVRGATEKISESENGDLNIDAEGKSINAIRSFAGKGTLVWGARTLDGLSDDWRFISVCRFFRMVQKSLEKTTNDEFYHETNDARIWVTAKTMVENYLNGLWLSGALAGNVAKEAYYVKVGLEDQTMTEADIVAGRMIIEIGMATVRPAEFIVLRFTHKLQQVLN